ncbi:MAG: hypothetical protein L0Y74_03600 [candidate division Zixibacteria bacterium]|nr:hypothetical protein [candidate division Zixibacteria bacterium]
MFKLRIMAMAFLLFFNGAVRGDAPVSKAEFESQIEKHQGEFREIAVTLAEIRSELEHINQDLGELKELRRTVFHRVIDIGLAGGLAFSGAAAWRYRRNERNSGK